MAIKKRENDVEIPYELKRRCIEARETMTTAEVYRQIFYPEHSYMSCESFRRALRKWKRKALASDKTLEAGTYGGFTAHNATVQVNGRGEVVQAWIKQGIDDNEYEQLLEAIKENIKPIKIEQPKQTESSMLEIPLFDMHFGVATIDDYVPLLAQILALIETKRWGEVNILIGQDLLHTNDLRGHTAKGTEIGTINFGGAWADAWRFWITIIDKAIGNAKEVKLRYSKGNHDECTSWCFVQALKARYPQLWVDDSFEPRRCITWNGVFIGYGHCEYTGSLSKIFQNFVLDFPKEFAEAEVREIHTGHLHSEGQDNGMMVRRLASGVPTDKWSKDNGYVGAHRRFQIFEWMPNRLKAIYYM